MPPAPAPASKPKPESAADAAPAPAAAAPAAGGGLKAWLPLLANLLLMPALAYATFNFLILPKMRGGAPASASASASTEASAEKGEEKSGAATAGSKEANVRRKTTVPLGAKVLVNVAGTMGTRYLLANITLVSNNPELKALVDKNDAELRDAAASTLSIKTITDIEKPGARNLIRTELISVFNTILGEGVVSDIYLTEFAIQ